MLNINLMTMVVIYKMKIIKSKIQNQQIINILINSFRKFYNTYKVAVDKISFGIKLGEIFDI